MAPWGKCLGYDRDQELWLWWRQGVSDDLELYGVGNLRSRGTFIIAEAMADVPKFGPTVSHLYHWGPTRTTHIPRTMVGHQECHGAIRGPGSRVKQQGKTA